MMQEDVDSDSQKQLTTLRDNRLRQKLMHDNVFRYVDSDSQKQLTTLRDNRLKEKLMHDNVFR